ncbi:MAG: SDR family oxidoreductase [Planctomycetaceae bacterium]|nr:SDR family oxidoreductase [Planctomycetales bacterium]MCB9874453.1 SDR family oxidoreductase [Planctomycetaceae bacterium]MCB9940970.1 SDR family oxidoreductase [Planctomycetaceae bacterium]HRX78236.1 SDR family oxidoreductase [Pirellulaceae bacterium]
MTQQAARFPDLTDRIAVITGGATGIGRATAVLLAEHGAKVFVGDFDPVGTATEETTRLGITELRCDVRVEADVKALIDQAVSAGSGLDILVNNAGIGMVKPITDVSEEEWDACLDTNLKGAFLATKHAIPHLRSRGGGSIVNMASNAGILPRAHDPVYSTSKGALVAFTKSIALCHSIDRIRVNAVCPGPVGDTRMMNSDLDKAIDRAAISNQIIAASPIARVAGRMISPREVAEAVLYLVCDASAMVTGTCIAIDGGKSLGVPPSGD